MGSLLSQGQLGICAFLGEGFGFEMCPCLFQSRLAIVAEKQMAQLSPEVDINSRLPPELINTIFDFLPFDDLKNALLVCRLIICRK